MLQTIKKQICLQKSDWLLGTGCELVMWLIGIAFMLVMQRSDPEDTYVLLGTIFAIIGSAGVATFIMAYGLGINFNTQISLGNRRTPFLISYYIAWVAGFFAYFGILLLVSQGEHAVYASIWVGTAIKEEFDLTGVLLQLGIPVCFALPALGTFCGALLLRYKRKAFWALWVLWMLGVLGIPNLMAAADNAVQSTAGKLGLVFRSVVQFIFGRGFPALAVVAAILLLTASWLLLRHQQVEN